MDQIIEITNASNHGLAQEGRYFTAKSAAGTGLATIAAQATLADTAPYVVLKSGAKRVWLDYLRLQATAAGTGGTALRFAVRTDATKADPTGGSALTPNNVNQESAAAAGSTVFAGALTAVAATGAKRELTSALLKNAIPAVGDTYLIKFGGADLGISTSASLVYLGAPPIILGPTQWCAFHIWLPSQTLASSYEIELGFVERE